MEPPGLSVVYLWISGYWGATTGRGCCFHTLLAWLPENTRPATVRYRMRTNLLIQQGSCVLNTSKFKYELFFKFLSCLTYIVTLNKFKTIWWNCLFSPPSKDKGELTKQTAFKLCQAETAIFQGNSLRRSPCVYVGKFARVSTLFPWMPWILPQVFQLVRTSSDNRKFWQKSKQNKPGNETWKWENNNPIQGLFIIMERLSVYH